jgi:ribosomal 30S subunit maturation factor RimM
LRHLALPDTQDNEFYWVDLLGPKAVNVVGEHWGSGPILKPAQMMLVVRGRAST